MTKKHIHTKRILQISVICALAAAIVLAVKSRALALFNENEAMTYGEYAAANTIENSTLFVGTYLININAMTDELYTKALDSASESNQTSMYYKSELADGQWFDVTDSESLNDIMNTAVAIPESELSELYVQYYVGSDGVVISVLEGDEINPFDIPDPYNLSKLKELEPLWLQYTSSSEADGISQSEYLENKNSNSTGNLRSDVYKYQLLTSFFAMDLRDDETDGYDADLARLNEAYKSYKSSGQDDEADIIYNLMAKVDASRRAVIMDKLSVMEVNALDVLNDLASGKYYTVSGDFLNPDTASEQADEDGGESDDFNDVSGDPEYIVELKESVEHEFDEGDDDDDEWWGVLQDGYEKDLATPSANGAPYSQDSSLTGAIGDCIQSCNQSYSTYQSEALTDDESVLGHAEYEYSSEVIEQTSAGGAGGPISYLRDVLNIKNSVVKNSDSEKSLLDSSLLDLAEGNFEEAVTSGEPSGYEAMLESGAGASAAETLLDDEFDKAESKRSELEFLIDAYRQREEASKALTYVNGCISWSNELYDEVPGDGFEAKADGCIDSHIKWLNDLADQIKSSDDSLKSDLDKLNDKKEELQSKRDQALDDNDLAGAKAYDKMIEAVDQDIAEQETNTGKNSDDDMADSILNDALAKIADDPDADVSSAMDALSGMGKSDAASKLQDRADAASGKSGSGADTGAGDGAGTGSGTGAGGGSGSGSGTGSSSGEGSGAGSGSGSGSGAGSSAGAGAGSGSGAGDGSGAGSSTGAGSGDGAGSGSGSGSGGTSGSGSDSGSGSGSGSDMTEEDILAVIESMFGKTPENMNADELSIVTASVSRFARTGNKAAKGLASGYAELMRSKNSKYLYNQYKDKTPRYISLKTIGQVSSFRYYYDDTRQKATLTSGVKAYVFKTGSNSLDRGGAGETLKYNVVMQKYPYISEDDAADLFDCHAEYVAGSGYAVCLTGTMEGEAKELLDALTGDSD